MSSVIEVTESATFSACLTVQVGSTAWEREPIRTATPDLEELETYADIHTVLEARALYAAHGKEAFIPFDELKGEIT